MKKEAPFLSRTTQLQSPIINSKSYDSNNKLFLLSLRAQRAWQSDEVVTSLTEAISLRFLVSLAMTFP